MANGPFDERPTHGHSPPLDGPFPPVPSLTGHNPQVYSASFILYFFIIWETLGTPGNGQAEFPLNCGPFSH